MSLSTLHTLHDVGERMLGALAADDYDAFCDLMQERDVLVRSLRGLDVSEDLEDAVRVLGEQHARLEEAMDGSNRRLSQGLAAFSRYRSANKAYRGTTRGGRLNKRLHG